MKKIIYTTGTLLLAFFCSVTQKVSVQAVSEQVEIKQQCEEILEKDTWKTEQKVVEDCLENFVEEEEKSTQDRKELSDMDSYIVLPSLHDDQGILGALKLGIDAKRRQI